MAAAPILQRRLGLFQSTVLNMIDMVGIGPFVTLPIVMGLMGGMFLYAWIAGALLSLVDAMIWSELGAAYPLAGGSYNFLKEAYGKNGMGRLMSFLYVWQTVIQAPLVAASAAIGFSQYLGYLIHLQDWQAKAVSGAVIIFITFLLYRKIDSIGKIGVLLWTGVLLTLGWIIIGGIAHGNFLQPLKNINTDFSWGQLVSFVFGQACVKTVYSYLGYYNVCHLGGEIKDPGKNIPRSMFISVIGIAVLYLAMNMSVGSVIPWQEIKYWQDNGLNNFVVSTFLERLYGPTAAKVGTIMILWVALASLFAVMLGYSRVPYAAAVDGAFFKVFGKLHPTKNFPYVSLLVLAALAFIFSLSFKMKHIIDGILAMRIMVQFIGQAAGVVLLRKRNGTENLPFKMPLYPLPVVLAIAMWLFIFYATGFTIILSFLLVFGSGLVVYFLMAKIKKQWPFVS
ncbi:APC family permease [Ferruginibacter sp.]|jgi:fructoselysine transporter|uniref:APC family permease n=2 Tax=Ferruginibacter sp. TaxID=1940288 RepID=UPI00199E5A1F|nr:APC family permease [Ferruginibacter sp.]MBC7626091.1 APC family permease [Ferruginibacter sp.]